MRRANCLFSSSKAAFCVAPHDVADQRCLGLATSIIGAIHLENPTRNGRAQFARPSNLCASLVDDGGGTPGLLIDTVTDADTTNVLISPVDGSTITEDIFGNPRTEAAGTVRDIGAVQLSLASTVAVSNPDTSGATVVWTQPKDPDPAFPITGYGVIVEPTDGSTAPVRIDVSGPDTLTVTFTGLAPNTEYRVTVVAVSANGDGPPSNMPS